MKKLYILKIGGSVATHKDRKGISVRTSLLIEMAKAIKKYQDKNKFSLILIHGAGSAGHQLAHKYGLKNGTGKDEIKWRGSILSRLVNQKLDSLIFEIFVKGKLKVVPVHTASVIIQNKRKISYFNTDIINEAIRQNCIPILYGEMVFDKSLGMSVCSGDAIAPYLAKKFKAKKIFFASDIDGIFTKDPHKHFDAELIKKINLKNISKKVKLSESHNIDVTSGLLGKIQKLGGDFGRHLESIEIFNGLKKENYKKIFSGKNSLGTKIFPK